MTRATFSVASWPLKKRQQPRNVWFFGTFISAPIERTLKLYFRNDIILHLCRRSILFLSIAFQGLWISRCTPTFPFQLPAFQYERSRRSILAFPDLSPVLNRVWNGSQSQARNTRALTQLGEGSRGYRPGSSAERWRPLKTNLRLGRQSWVSRKKWG